jgi:hypothetical protein
MKPMSVRVSSNMAVDADVLSAFASLLSAGHFYVERPLSGIGKDCLGSFTLIPPPYSSDRS